MVFFPYLLPVCTSCLLKANQPLLDFSQTIMASRVITHSIMSTLIIKELSGQLDGDSSVTKIIDVIQRQVATILKNISAR